jgi:hypothetical protein
MLKEENYDTPEFRNSFKFLLSNKYTINIILYSIINIVYSFYKNKKITSDFNTDLTEEIHEIYNEYGDEGLDEKPLYNTNDTSLTDEDREFLVELNRLRRDEDFFYTMDLEKVIKDLSINNKIILYIQLLKNLYKIKLITNENLYKYYLKFKPNKINIYSQKEKEPLTYSLYKYKRLSTAAINRYPAISERLRLHQFKFSTSDSTKSSTKSSTRSSTKSSTRSSQ